MFFGSKSRAASYDLMAVSIAIFNISGGISSEAGYFLCNGLLKIDKVSHKFYT